MDSIAHALVLNLHQPPGNLEGLLLERPWEAKEILYAMDRMPRALWNHEDIARVHLSLSGTLLETLSNPDFQQSAYGIVDCGSLLWHLQNSGIFQVLGTAYYHSVLPLIPSEDREQQVWRWLGIGRHLFWRPAFAGFWPPEMGFSMELIPLLADAGYRYVVVDSDYVDPVTPMQWHDLRYRPHLAQYGGKEIVVVVRDRELSDAQESGMECEWFEREVRARTRWCDFPPLVTTCTDGDNGGWFRNVDRAANFWGAFYGELLERARSNASPIRPTFIDDYIDLHGAHGYVTVRTGAWNTGWHHGADFMQWTGSRAQQDALDRIWTVSRSVHDTRRHASRNADQFPLLQQELEGGLWHLLRAQTSCYLYWGEAWVNRAHQDLDRADAHLARAREMLH